MKKIIYTLMVLTAMVQLGHAQAPEITSWIRNTTGATGYNGIPSNIQSVSYTATDVYVSATCIPGYSIGPWAGNPNVPANQNFVYKITRSPLQNTGTSIATGLGHIGVWSNGVSIFNAKDGMSYNNAGVWNRDAYYWEGSSFDNCLGHPAPNGEYHNHVNPTCLYDDADSLNHSPIIGYAFDGFPVYGAYGYTNTNGTGPVKRMRSSFVLSTATTRVNGPAVNVTYPAGCFIEDNIYTAGSGDLDDHNGRFCVTPDYPAGIYAYFVTIDSALNPVYPYTAGPTYYGTIPAGNTGPGSGHNTIPGSAVVYNGSLGINGSSQEVQLQVVPNPVHDYAFLYTDPSGTNVKGQLYNAQGQLLETIENIQPGIPYTLDFTGYPSGVYFLHLEKENQNVMQKIVKVN